jgi:hypothetical protein
MRWSLDARIPLVFGRVEDAGPDDAVLIEGDAPVAVEGAVVRIAPSTAIADHAPGCACCLPRPPVAAALGGLFLARARGEVTFFRRVVAVVADDVQIRAAIAGDPLVSGRFRLG